MPQQHQRHGHLRRDPAAQTQRRLGNPLPQHLHLIPNRDLQRPKRRLQRRRTNSSDHPPLLRANRRYSPPINPNHPPQYIPLHSPKLTKTSPLNRHRHRSLPQSRTIHSTHPKQRLLLRRPNNPRPNARHQHPLLARNLPPPLRLPHRPPARNLERIPAPTTRPAPHLPKERLQRLPHNLRLHLGQPHPGLVRRPPKLHLRQPHKHQIPDASIPARKMEESQGLRNTLE